MELLMKLEKNEGIFAKSNNRDLRLVKSKAMSDKVVAAKPDASTFLKDFEEIIHVEMQKSSYCIDRINDDIIGHNKDLRFQLNTLKELWRLVPPSKDREERAVNIMNKIAVSRQTIKEYEICILLIQRRALLLQEELCTLSLSQPH